MYKENYSQQTTLKVQSPQKKVIKNITKLLHKKSKITIRFGIK